MVETTTRTIQRQTPSNVEAEQAVIGSLLLDPEAVTKVAAFLRAHDCDVCQGYLFSKPTTADEITRMRRS